MTDRSVAAAYAAALVFVASYAVQRGVGWWLAVDAGVMASTHTAFYWRCALAALHGGIAALLVGFGARDPSALVRARWAVWAVVLPAIGSLAVFQ